MGDFLSTDTGAAIGVAALTVIALVVVFIAGRADVRRAARHSDEHRRQEVLRDERRAAYRAFLTEARQVLRDLFTAGSDVSRTAVDRLAPLETDVGLSAPQPVVMACSGVMASLSLLDARGPEYRASDAALGDRIAAEDTLRTFELTARADLGVDLPPGGSQPAASWWRAGPRRAR